MNLGMTIRTAIGEELLNARSCIQCMAPMTLQAKKRHRRVEKVAVDRTVGSVTVGTVFRYIGVFEDKRSLFLHMAPGTGFLGGCPSEKLVLH